MTKERARMVGNLTKKNKNMSNARGSAQGGGGGGMDTFGIESYIMNPVIFSSGLGTDCTRQEDL